MLLHWVLHRRSDGLLRLKEVIIYGFPCERGLPSNPISYNLGREISGNNRILLINEWPQGLIK